MLRSLTSISVERFFRLAMAYRHLRRRSPILVSWARMLCADSPSLVGWNNPNCAAMSQFTQETRYDLDRHEVATPQEPEATVFSARAAADRKPLAGGRVADWTVPRFRTRRVMIRPMVWRQRNSRARLLVCPYSLTCGVPTRRKRAGGRRWHPGVLLAQPTLRRAPCHRHRE